jgi:hypothetical protein
MSEAPVDFAFESKKLLIEVIYDSCIKAGWSVGGVKVNEITSVANDKGLEDKYKIMLSGFGNQKLITEEYSPAERKYLSRGEECSSLFPVNGTAEKK